MSSQNLPLLYSRTIVKMQKMEKHKCKQVMSHEQHPENLTDQITHITKV